jgi:chromosome segregation ATPase
MPPDADNSLAALDSLLRQATVLARTALDQTAKLDPAHVRAQLAEAEAARLRAEAQASAATARAAEAQRQVEALTEALAEAREEARAAREELERAQVRRGVEPFAPNNF